MTNNKTGQNPLETLYFVVIALCITKAIKDLVDNWFLLTQFLLFLSFTVTVVRFSEGVARIFKQKRDYPILDFYGFFAHAMVFYWMAKKIPEPGAFLIAFAVMLVFDTIWILGIGALRKWDFYKPEKQWLLSNSLLLIIWGLLFLFCREWSERCLAILILLFSFGFSVWDECYNWKYYKGEHQGEKTPLFGRQIKQ